MRRVLLGLMVVAATGLAACVAFASPAFADRANPAADEQAFVARINELRASKGLPPLRVDQELTGIGRRWAAKMAEAGQISHNRNFPNEVSQDWEKLGENVGVGSNVDELHQAFVDSPAHYRNLVDRDFTHIGVGVVYAEDGSLYTSHQFMKLRSAPTAPPPPPPTTTPTTSRSRTTVAAGPSPSTRVPPPPESTQPGGGTPPTTPRDDDARRLRVLEMLEELRRLGAYRSDD